MKRRDFVQSLFAATAVSGAAPASSLAKAADKKDNPSGPEPKPGEFA